MSAKPSASQLEKIAKRYFADRMISAEAERVDRLYPGPLYREPEPAGMDPETYEYESLGDLRRQRDCYDEIIEVLERNTSFNEFHDIRHQAETLLKEGGFKFEPDNGTSRRLSALLLRAELSVNLIMRSRAYGQLDAASEDPLFVIDEDIGEQSTAGKIDGSGKQTVPGNRFADQFSPPLEWEELTVTFQSNDMVQLYGRNKKAKYGFAELGFKDGRKGDAHTSLWVLLRDGFGRNEGKISWNDPGSTNADQHRQLTKMVSRMRHVLMDGIGILDDPFFAYGTERGYQLKFNIIDRRSSKQKRGVDALDTSYEDPEDYNIEDLIRDETKQN